MPTHPRTSTTVSSGSLGMRYATFLPLSTAHGARRGSLPGRQCTVTCRKRFQTRSTLTITHSTTSEQRLHGPLPSGCCSFGTTRTHPMSLIAAFTYTREVGRSCRTARSLVSSGASIQALQIASSVSPFPRYVIYPFILENLRP